MPIVFKPLDGREAVSLNVFLARLGEPIVTCTELHPVGERSEWEARVTLDNEVGVPIRFDGDGITSGEALLALVESINGFPGRLSHGLNTVDMAEICIVTRLV